MMFHSKCLYIKVSCAWEWHFCENWSSGNIPV